MKYCIHEEFIDARNVLESNMSPTCGSVEKYSGGAYYPPGAYSPPLPYTFPTYIVPDLRVEYIRMYIFNTFIFGNTNTKLWHQLGSTVS